jgi:WD40 repeat protein
VDYSLSGDFYAIGTKSGSIRIFDENTKSLSVTLRPGIGDRQGHSNRVYSVRYIDENTIVSGGWDNNVIIWDIRQH